MQPTLLFLRFRASPQCTGIAAGLALNLRNSRLYTYDPRSLQVDHKIYSLPVATTRKGFCKFLALQTEFANTLFLLLLQAKGVFL